MKIFLYLSATICGLILGVEAQQENFLSKLILGSKLKGFKYETASFTGYVSDPNESSEKAFAMMPLMKTAVSTKRNSFPPPPENPNHARVARYLVHNLGKTPLFGQNIWHYNFNVCFRLVCHCHHVFT